MKVYQVRDWERKFENDRSRQRERCGFVALPNKNGKGKQLILREPDGAMIFGWFALVCEELSRQRKHRHGWLTDAGLTADSPWSDAELTVITGCTPEQTARAISVLIRPEIRWLVVTHRAVTADSQPSNRLLTSEQRGEEQTGEERRGEEQTREEQAPKAPPVVAVPDPPKDPQQRRPGVMAPCLIARGITYFGGVIAIAQAHLDDAVGKVGETWALAWLLVADQDRVAGAISTNPLQYYRGLLKKGEPPDWALAEAKKLLRPHKPPAVDTGPVAVAEVLKGAADV